MAEHWHQTRTPAGTRSHREDPQPGAGRCTSAGRARRREAEVLAHLPQVTLRPESNDINRQGHPHPEAATLKKLIESAPNQKAGRRVCARLGVAMNIKLQPATAHAAGAGPTDGGAGAPYRSRTGLPLNMPCYCRAASPSQHHDRPALSVARRARRRCPREPPWTLVRPPARGGGRRSDALLVRCGHVGCHCGRPRQGCAPDAPSANGTEPTSVRDHPTARAGG